MEAKTLISEKLHETILILDFGSQYTQLIARRIREMNVFSEIQPFNYNLSLLRDSNIKGLILSGGPSSVYEDNAPKIEKEIFELGIPVLGICYGLQLLTYLFGGKIAPAEQKEYGLANLNIINSSSGLFKNISGRTDVWMSHGDKVTRMPDQFNIIAETANSPYAAIKHKNEDVYGIQFHPEVIHTVEGKNILHNFIYNVCGCEGDWSPQSFIEESVKVIRQKVGKKHVLCAMSGGVDSSVVAVLLHKAIGKQLHCIFIDTGLLRLNEAKDVEEIFRKNFDIDLTCINSSTSFYSKLQGVQDPEEKRKVIGNEFIRVFEQEAKKIGHFDFLAQGTLYPDVIESVSFKGPSATIKSHHNVGGLPEQFDFELIEPLRELFKDEVRKVGRELNIPEKVIGRHPFPGPGLAVRILGTVSLKRVDILQKADAIYIDELHKHKIYNEIWQAFAVLLRRYQTEL